LTVLRTELEHLIAACRAALQEPIEVLQVLGPRAAADAVLAQAEGIVRPGPDLPERFAGADLVISAAGYNSILELACTDVCVLLVPVRRTYDDQFGRALRWERRLGLCHRPAEHERSVGWMVQVLRTSRRRPAVELGPSGAALCAALIEELCR
jgi:predicted glycosyltransferase